MHKKFFIRAYGCQMNQYEAGIVSTIMNDAGYTQVDTEFDADIVYLVTCSVRDHAEKRAIGRLNSIRRLKKTNPDLIIGILGCMAQSYKEILGQKYNADIVAGPDEYRKLPELINNYKKLLTPQVRADLTTENYEGLFPKVDSKVTGCISIMRGCNNFCTYCIVPYVRGRERSKSKTQIIEEAKNLINCGVREITLVGQNVLAWNDHELTFLDLLEDIDNLDGFERLRFITSHPKDLIPKHFESFASLKKLCPHIHLPLQSGSNRILELMNRGYERKEYIDKIKQAREIIPEVSFTTDIMVGFPTETEQDFEDTLDVISSVRFDFAYMYKYSERPHTKSQSIVPKVCEETSQKRLTRLIDLQNKITKEKSITLLDKTVEVLVESKNGKKSLARTKNDKIVIINEPVEIGKIYNSRIIKIAGWTPIGNIVDTMINN